MGEDAFGGAGRDGVRRRGQGELEAQVLAALHQSPGPATAAWVQQRLGGDLAYTTVMTILSRLRAKKAVTRERDGRSYVWTPAADEAGLAALRMRRVLDSETDRDAVLTSFVSALSEHDEQLLRSLLERASDAGDVRDATNAGDVRDATNAGDVRDAADAGDARGDEDTGRARTEAPAHAPGRED
ncbi:BlaI/MecI/CopY family transcriptional regulator [Streptomyces sp. MST-110588]|uniref:BlaI/MecI/CopY family transcriptional regulator n=1 Tax=Streptomyces sp. MST-110588 TaxID=2833628 RepID=UPI001F5DFEF7|nr:BlaI/MecI/CopY family transcriptional regulator [Streptomyces sp. MST-110588]UNO41105.1 BlaI/MecI/CopY family transcriptional regulator [Streptomyces sp. MST-110588]